MKRFLVVKTSSIGDVIQSFHLIDYLKNRFPHCQIDWVVEKTIAPLLRAHPDLETVLEVDTRCWRKSLFTHRHCISSFSKELRKKNYDVLFDVQGNTKSGFITGLAKADKKVGYDWKNLPEKTNFFATNVHLPVIQSGSVRERYLQLLQDFFGDADPVITRPLHLKLSEREEFQLERFAQIGFQRPRLMICFGSNWRNKMLSENTLFEFLHLIDEKLSPFFIFVFGNEEEREVADRLERAFSRNGHAVGDMSLPLWQRFMEMVEGVIAMDSAALHLCATTMTPSFSLFGPSSAHYYKPLGKQHYAFQGQCPYEVEFEKRCPHLRNCQSGSCLRDVSADLLFEHFQTFWADVSIPLAIH